MVPVAASRAEATCLPGPGSLKEARTEEGTGAPPALGFGCEPGCQDEAKAEEVVLGGRWKAQEALRAFKDVSILKELV